MTGTKFDRTQFEQPSLTVDIVVFAMREGALHLLVIERGIPPFEGCWALPGGFVLPRESVDQAAARELEEETNLRDVYLEQLYTFSEPERDPRGRVVSVAHMALLPADRVDQVQGGSDARAAKFERLPASIERIEPADGRSTVGKSKRKREESEGYFAFDHDVIVATALARLRGKLEFTTLAFELLPEEFTLTEAQHVYEAILGRELDKVTFRRRLLAMELVRETPRMRRGAHRPARLYRAAPRASVWL
ncbi:MAG: NUDIX domain-containing protein [Deltaproteobacteria bacterium]|nr:NUDIX domain-containing protein [Deltaproteobacteria bacterium]